MIWMVMGCALDSEHSDVRLGLASVIGRSYVF